jgi:hypothetical protein
MALSLSSALEKLATFRTNNTRASQQTFANASVILKSAQKLGDDGALSFVPASFTDIYNLYMLRIGWAVLEQLFLASVDIGRLEVADVCLRHVFACALLTSWS